MESSQHVVLTNLIMFSNRIAPNMCKKMSKKILIHIKILALTAKYDHDTIPNAETLYISQCYVILDQLL